MVKQQKVCREKKKEPTVIREKPLPSVSIDPKYANAPVRAVHFVEVGKMSPTQLQIMLKELSRLHDNAKGGIHYLLPVRDGKIGPDIVFEEEFERIGKELFEVVDTNGVIIEGATIRLKGGAKDVLVIRDRI